jgi:hypothetical protein
MRFLLALAVIGVVVYFIVQRAPAPLAHRSGESDRTTATAVEPARRSPRVGDAEFTPENLREGLAKTGQVVREQARIAGEKLDDGRVVAAIKGKFALDRDLSALDLRVTSDDGRVSLTGSVASAELAERAAELARTTDGVVAVDSRLQVDAR